MVPVDRLFPGTLGRGPGDDDEEQALPPLPDRNWRVVSVKGNEEGELRVITIGPTYSRQVTESFDQIRGSAEGNVGMRLRMLGALQTIARLTASPGRRRVLRQEVERIGEL